MNGHMAGEIIERLQRRLRAAIVGRNEVIDLLIVALLADGHVLLEDYPGSGKTTLAKALGQSIVSDETQLESMRRIQFTPDLLPSDVTGTTIFDPDARTFEFRPGPVFTHILLADEINRTSPKVQSALLKPWVKSSAPSIIQRTHSVICSLSSQHKIHLDLAGTFPLPTAQLRPFSV